MDVAEVVAQVGRHQEGLASAAQLHRAGITRSRLSRAVTAGRVLRVRPQVYALDPLAPLPRFVVTHDGVARAYARHVRAVLLELGPTCAAGGRTAAALYGWPLLVEPARTVDVAVDHGRSHTASRGVRVSRHRRLVTWEREVTAGGRLLRLTSPAQTLLDITLSRPVLEAVAAVDSALRARHVSEDELVAVFTRCRSLRPRRLLPLCSADSGSVPESVLRVRMAAAGLAPRTQFVIRDGVRHVLRADFCFPDIRLVVEVDGARWHQETARDRDTDNLLAALGWRVLRFSGSDVLRDPATVLARVQQAVASARATGSTHEGRKGTGVAA